MKIVAVPRGAGKTRRIAMKEEDLEAVSKGIGQVNVYREILKRIDNSDAELSISEVSCNKRYNILTSSDHRYIMTVFTMIEKDMQNLKQELSSSYGVEFEY